MVVAAINNLQFWDLHSHQIVQNDGKGGKPPPNSSKAWYFKLGHPEIMGKQGSNDSHYSQIMILVSKNTDIGCCLTR